MSDTIGGEPGRKPCTPSGHRRWFPVQGIRITTKGPRGHDNPCQKRLGGFREY
jgi:hypothetical protein